jgi:hypothetical protein
VAPEIGENREALLAAAALTGVELGAVAAAEVVARADRGLEGAEAAMRAVPVATLVGAREADVAATGWLGQAGAGERVQCLEAVAVRAHVHPEVGVTAEALAADVAEVDVLRKQLVGFELDDVVVAVALGDRSRAVMSGGGRNGGLLGRRGGRGWSGDGRRRRWSGCRDGGCEEGGGVEDDEARGGGDLGGDGVDVGRGEGLQLAREGGGDAAADGGHVVPKGNEPEKSGAGVPVPDATAASHKGVRERAPRHVRRSRRRRRETQGSDRAPTGAPGEGGEVVGGGAHRQWWTGRVRLGVPRRVGLSSIEVGELLRASPLGMRNLRLRCERTPSVSSFQGCVTLRRK